MTAQRPSAEKDARSEGWAFLSPNGVGAHYFRDGKSFCGRDLPADVRVYGDVFGAGSDPEECRRCARRAHDEADALDALMDAEEDDDTRVTSSAERCTCSATEMHAGHREDCPERVKVMRVTPPGQGQA